ncbi:MAG: hypothetical protein QM500_04130 [Methylococcales bacterium]
MGRLDRWLADAKEVKLAELKQPRIVQTVEQRSVDTRQQVGAAPVEPRAKDAGSGSIGFFDKHKKHLMILGGVLVAGFIAKKVL